MGGMSVPSIPLHIQPVDVGVLFGVTTEVMERQARAHAVRLHLHIDDDVPTTVILDREKVGWAITSLVGSALRHVQGPGGTIDVRVSRDALSGLVVCVRDNGPGISAERVKKLLHRDTWRAGSALALLLVEDIVVAHGGRLEIESNTDAHDHFVSVRFTIPIL
jgi:signal transduction histidine kinase